MKNKGFTLIELMITVAVVGILASIAIPGYRDYILRSEISEAVANLSGMRVKLEQYYQDNRIYDGACEDGTIAPIPSMKYFDMTCDIEGNNFLITATGKTNGFVFTIDQDGNRATTAVPNGWTINESCWIGNKNGECR